MSNIKELEEQISELQQKVNGWEIWYNMMNDRVHDLEMAMSLRDAGSDEIWYGYEDRTE